jgi:hypothetical protein
LLDISEANILWKYTFQFIFTTVFCWIHETHTRHHECTDYC